MKISVVAPFYNEEEAISGFINDIKKTIEKEGEKFEWEFIFVDDGSTDRTKNILLSSSIPNLRVITTQHFGLSHALFIGIEHAGGELIATIDTDGQFNFEDVIRLAETLINEDADIVVGYRFKRKDNRIRIISSKIANLIKKLVIGDKIHDSTCTLRVFRSKIRNRILYGFDGFHRFIPTFALLNNLKLIELPIESRERIGGKAKFGVLNRLPDVIVDIMGVWWLKYKRFDVRSDERRFSFYPDLFFLVLFLHVFTQLFKEYFRVVDDFWLYGSLNRFIGHDYSKSYGWDNFIFNEIVPPLIRFLYAIIMNIGSVLGVAYPLEWANKTIGLIVTLTSYIIFIRFFSLHFKRHHAKWISLLIVFWGISSSEIFSGLARSFSFVLIPSLLICLQRFSVISLSSITFFTALLYPILLPLFFITIALYAVFSNLKRFYTSVIPIISGLLGLTPMLISIDLTSFSPAKEGDSFLLETNLFELPLSSDFNLLFSSFVNIGIIEWLNFNLLHQWALSDKLVTVIEVILPILFLVGILRRLMKKKGATFDVIAFVFIMLFWSIGLNEREYVEISYLFKWGVLLTSVYFVTGVVDSNGIKKQKVMFIFAISSILSFILIRMLSQKFGFGVHEPGRQLQRAFAVILPFTASIFFYMLYRSLDGLKRFSVLALLCLSAIAFFPEIKLVVPRDKYVIERIRGLPKGSTILSHPLTANWIVTHTDKYSTIIDEQIRVTKKNPIRGSKEKILPTRMAAIIMDVYYGKDIQSARDWCHTLTDGYILVEEYYYSEEFFKLRRNPYISFVEKNNPNKDFALLKVPQNLRHPITPESYLLSCEQLVERW
ncbi:MAG: glycosyltransferase family 2 protein [Deltaproteobacteria bacterium]|nr:glycosyltransferase family 2 protein [Deltaproteobacteria bacterium]